MERVGRGGRGRGATEVISAGPVRGRLVLFGAVLGASSALSAWIGRSPLGGVVALVFAVLAVRAARTGVVVDGDGLRIRGLLHDRALSWSTVALVSMTLSSRWRNHRCLHVVTVDGRDHRVLGVSVASRMLPLPSDDPFAQGALRRLAAVLADHGVPTRVVAVPD